MNTNKNTLLHLLWILGLIVLTIIAISPLIALGSNQIIFTVVPVLETVRISVFGN